MGRRFRQVDFCVETAIFFLAHDNGILPIIVQSAYFNGLGQPGRQRELYFAIILGLEKSLL
jgi:hypothetical protein